MRLTGFSTGCLWKTNLSILERVKLYKEAGANAIEISFLKPEYLDDFEVTDELKELLKEFKFISVHATCVNSIYNSKNIELIQKMKNIYDKLGAEYCVAHPDVIEDFNALKKVDVNWLIENMDPRKTIGTDAEHFKDWEEFDICLDLCHSHMFGKDHEKTKGFIKNYKDKIKEIHISGILNGERHGPTFMSDDNKIIKEMAQKVPDPPLISEGVFEQKDIEEIKIAIKKEIEFLKSI